MITLDEKLDEQLDEVMGELKTSREEQIVQSHELPTWRGSSFASPLEVYALQKWTRSLLTGGRMYDNELT